MRWLMLDRLIGGLRRAASLWLADADVQLVILEGEILGVCPKLCFGMKCLFECGFALVGEDKTRLLILIDT